jgi:hypothetical protein
MIWLCDCPFWWDQGRVGPVMLEDGQVVLACDSCGAMWRTPEDVEADRGSESGETHEIGGGDPQKRPISVRWATREDVDMVGWGELPWHSD